MAEETESEYFRGTVLAIEEINAAGGVLGRPIVPVCYDPRSDSAEYRRYADKLLVDDGVSVIFGCLLSASRKAILGSLERRNGLLWYPANYEGFEYSPNVIYTGAAPNQSTMQLAGYIISHVGKDITLVGSDYVFPRETNRLLRCLIESAGGRIVDETYVPIVPDEIVLRRVVDGIKRDRPAAVVSTIIGCGTRPFYRFYRDAGLDPRELPVGSLSLAENQVSKIGPEYCSGHITSATYFASVDTSSSRRFQEGFARRFGRDSMPSYNSESAYNQIYLFSAALERAGVDDPQKLAAAAAGVEFDAPQGRVIVDADNNHTWLNSRIGILNDRGQFDLVWEALHPVKPDPYLISHSFDYGAQHARMPD
ncbi:transporter substrate-binding domain-containing protein [Paraburkholderia fungorum]|nr:transporter substrate-binding domain-containing protein [Paraburkholderia fungorum]